MRHTLIALSAAAAFSVVVTTAPVGAQNAKVIKTVAIEDDSAEERINFSGKLRMLSQRIPSAACHLANDIDQEASKKLLENATIEFEKILRALEFGDADLNIHSSENRRLTLARIHALRENWEPFKATAEAIIAGDASEENMQSLFSDNMNLLEFAKDLVSEVVEQYSNPTKLLQADAMLIDISGRQRMLTQKMSKESCMLASSLKTKNTPDELQGTMEIFELSLNALRHGLPEIGIKKPPTNEISAGLENVFKEWMQVKPMLMAILAEADNVDAELNKQKFHALNSTMATMNKVVGMYAVAAKR
ncbi:MAG: hypothetical protein HKN27_17870 [Silicimonas sp.]|nr:hypothetical protein [Silicimonas sp.]